MRGVLHIVFRSCLYILGGKKKIFFLLKNTHEMFVKFTINMVTKNISIR